jgi:hypothetical protein
MRLASLSLASLSLAALTTLAACDSPAAPLLDAVEVTRPSAAMVINTRSSFTNVPIFNHQCGLIEEVLMSGTVHLVETEVEKNGQVKRHQHATMQATGIGTITGDQYKLHWITKDFTELTPGTTEAVSENRSLLVRQGKGDNVWVRTTFHFSFPSMELVLIRMETECRG